MLATEEVVLIQGGGILLSLLPQAKGAGARRLKTIHTCA